MNEGKTVDFAESDWAIQSDGLGWHQSIRTASYTIHTGKP